jgi:hypothetical protein
MQIVNYQHLHSPYDVCTHTIIMKYYNITIRPRTHMYTLILLHTYTHIYASTHINARTAISGERHIHIV